jgi:endogenous inhibitor of DNA gyrase (YacG/DUF329 family)
MCEDILSKKCERCQKPITTKRTHGRFCGSTCRHKAWLHRKLASQDEMRFYLPVLKQFNNSVSTVINESIPLPVNGRSYLLIFT